MFISLRFAPNQFLLSRHEDVGSQFIRQSGIDTQSGVDTQSGAGNVSSHQQILKDLLPNVQELVLAPHADTWQVTRGICRLILR